MCSTWPEAAAGQAEGQGSMVRALPTASSHYRTLSALVDKAYHAAEAVHTVCDTHLGSRVLNMPPGSSHRHLLGAAGLTSPEAVPPRPVSGRSRKYMCSPTLQDADQPLVRACFCVDGVLADGSQRKLRSNHIHQDAA